MGLNMVVNCDKCGKDFEMSFSSEFDAIEAAEKEGWTVDECYCCICPDCQ
jgi:hypothetical protein